LPVSGIGAPFVLHPGKRIVEMNLFEKLNRKIARAIHDYDLIRDGDRILVAVSGGKDSLLMLHFLSLFQKKSPVPFELLAVHLDQGDSLPVDELRELIEGWGLACKIVSEDIRSVVKAKVKEGEIQCPLCSRMRRGILYRTAREEGCNKIALGHHQDDLLQTFLLNAFFSGKLGTMTPIYEIQEGDLKVIRPLVYLEEEWIETYVAEKGWPILACSSCGSADVLRRKQIATLLGELEGRFPRIKQSLAGAIKNPHCNELLDRSLWSHPDFARP